MNVEYSSNNSGGRWWLKDEHWKALAAAGWTVIWGGRYFCKSRYSVNEKPIGKPEPCASAEECTGHRRFDSADEMSLNGRFLGALAQHATKDFASIADGVREFERLTSQTASDEGCNCCGAPHSFNWTDEKGKQHYASGEDILPLLYGDGPKTLREAYEALRK